MYRILSIAPFNPLSNSSSGDLPHLKAPKDLTDEFRNRMLHDNPVRFYRFSKSDIAAAMKAKGN